MLPKTIFFTCRFVPCRTSVKGHKSTLNITDHFDCTTSNIYYIQWSECHQLYLWEIGGRLGDHIRDHLYHIRNNDLCKAVNSIRSKIHHPNNSLYQYIKKVKSKKSKFCIQNVYAVTVNNVNEVEIGNNLVINEVFSCNPIARNVNSVVIKNTSLSVDHLSQINNPLLLSVRPLSLLNQK